MCVYETTPTPFPILFFLSNHRTAWMFSSEEVTGLFRHLFTTTLILWTDLVMPNDWLNVDIQRLSRQSPLVHSLLLVSGNTPLPVASCCLGRYCTTLLSWGLQTRGLQGFTKYVLGLHFPEFLKKKGWTVHRTTQISSASLGTLVYLDPQRRTNHKVSSAVMTTL